MNLFLSYNSKNRAFVEPIARFLEQSGDFDKIFYDQESIEAGDRWIKIIQDGIESSNASLIFIGEEGIGGWQNKEILSIVNDSTSKDNYRIIPVILPPTNKFINYRLPWFLADYQWVEFENSNDNYAFSKLLDGLRNREETNLELVGKNPYKGLESFDVEDSYYFFGRDYDLNLVFHNKLRFHVSIENHNFLAIIADSGVGKSSFVKAGILAALEKGRFAGSESWKQIIFKPGKDPLTQLYLNLAEAKLIEKSTEAARKFESDTKKFDDELLKTFNIQQETWLIYIDQFEEIITQCKNEDERSAFLNNLARVIETDKVILLLSVRSDFYTAFAPYVQFKGILEKNNFTLSNIEAFEKDDDKARHVLTDIIVKPAKNADVEIEPVLVDRIINDIKKVKGKLPILELALDQLWNNRKESSKITLQDYLKVSNENNIEGIIQTLADKIYNEITRNGTDERKINLFKRIFIPHLIEVTINQEDVRKTALKEDLLAIKGYSTKEIEDLIQKLSGEKSRLLTVQNPNYQEEDTCQETRVEVVHEVIIREWPLLKGWIAERREQLKIQRRISNDAEDWVNGIGELYTKRLDNALLWREMNPDLTDNAIDKFLEMSKSELEKVELERLKKERVEKEARDKEAKDKLEKEIAEREFAEKLQMEADIAARKKAVKLRNNKIAIFVITLLSFIGFLYYIYILHKKTVDEIKSLPSLKRDLTLAGGKLESMKFLQIDSSNYNLLKDNLHYFKGLDSLQLYNLPIFDIKIAKDLNSLRYLSITSNSRLISLAGIENLKYLQSLIMYYNTDLNSLAGIEQLDSLKNLIVSYNDNLKDLSGIEKLKSLNSLEVGFLNPVNGLSKIKILPSLKRLSMSCHCNMTDLEWIKELTALRLLTISNNDSLTNLSGIGEIGTFDSLSIYSNRRLISLSGIEDLKSLSYLDISSNDRIPNLSGLQNLPSLKSLLLSGNFNLSSLFGIDNLSSINSLNISFNPSIINLSSLEKLQTLKTIEVNENELTLLMNKKYTLPNLERIIIPENSKIDKDVVNKKYPGVEIVKSTYY